LGKSDSSLIIQIKTALLKLPPTGVSWDGSIMEWASEIFSCLVTVTSLHFYACHYS